MSINQHALALAETLSEAARTGGDAALGPIGRTIAIPALRELLGHVDGLLTDIEAGVTSFSPTAGHILAIAIRAKATTDAADAFVNSAVV